MKLSQGIKLKLPSSNHIDDAEVEPLQGMLHLKISIPEDFNFLGNFENSRLRGSHVFALCVVNGSEWTSAPLGYSRAHEKLHSNGYEQEAFL